MLNTVTASFAAQHRVDAGSASEHLGKIHAHGLRASLLGGTSFDPSFRPISGGFRGREGYTNVTPKKKTHMMYMPNTLWTWSFAIVTLVQTVVTLGLEWCVPAGKSLAAEIKSPC